MHRHKTLLFLSLLIPLYAIAGIPEGYYTNANGKKKTALKAALHDIIRPLKANEKSYGSGNNSTWSGFYVTDRIASTNQVIDRYSYDKRYFSSSDNANYADAISGMNIEHSFAKSWWGGSKNEAYQDLFNLMPCESGINTSKSNYAMGKVTNVKTTNGCTKVGTGPTSSGNTKNLWEPADEWKGDFARDYFYMVTAYSDLSWTSNGLDMLEKNDWPTLQEWAYTLFLQWAKDDPVDEMERARNDAVYGIQKNRNPFIDFPNLAEYIWGDSVDFAFSIDGTSTGGGGGTIDPTPDLATLVDCSMKAGLDPFFVRTYEGCEGEVWTSDATYGAKANAFNISSKEADEYLMVNLDLSLATEATLTFQHATGYNGSTAVKDTYFQVLVTDNYDGVPEDATWDLLDVTFPSLPSSSSFTSFVSSGDVRLDDYCGKNVTLAFRYTSNSSACYCWEIQNVKVTTHTDPDALPLIAEDIETRQVITYDLMGRRVPNDTKGLVIRNGKKILQR
ncbi:MAG: endonuclease [Bacteroidaceae bacterium]|nr:endonuclease [Bacteroidaceae bacterium]